MEEYKVLKNFQDSQNNLSLHKVGETVGLSKKRGDELTEMGFVEPLVETDDAAPKEKEEKSSGKTKELKPDGQTK